jgi:ELWxxDGT repeat protein
MSTPARYVYASNGSLYITNGTTAGTTLLKAATSSFAAGQSFGLLNATTVLFGASSNGTGSTGAGYQLWMTDGTAAGTQPVATLPTSTAAGAVAQNEAIFNIVTFGNAAVFTLSDGSGNSALYVTNGSSATFALPDSNQAFASPLAIIGSKLLFTSSSGLVVTDGTVAGTTIIKATNSASGGFSTTSNVVSLGNGQAMFVASAGGAGFTGTNQLWITDGTAANTKLVTTLPDNTPAGSASSFALGTPEGVVNGKLILAYADGSNGTSYTTLYASDGTASGTIALPNGTGFVGGTTLPSGKFVFATTSGLYVTDGTKAGTTQIKANSGNFYPEKFDVLPNGDALFTVAPQAPTANYPFLGDTQLWITDGTASGTTLLETLPSNGLTSEIDPIGLLTSGYLFAYNNGSTGQPLYGNLYGSNGTVAGDVALTTNGYDSFPSQDQAFLPCFVEGTRIATPLGERPVENLQVGDEVLTTDGQVRKIIWLGQRWLDCAHHRQPDEIRPIRICADAFAPAQPHRDVLLSPDHAVFVEGVLIPVRYLVNGVTIRQESPSAVTYFHVELSEHAVLLAEGLPVESYLDSGNRAQFAGPEITAHFAALSWDNACAPLCVTGLRLERIRTKLRDRIMSMGCRIGEAEPTLSAAGRIIAPVHSVGAMHKYRLPDAAINLMILSPSEQPCAIEPTSSDRRWLGVAINGILLDGRPVPLHSELLAEGFYPIENGWRWTNGAARLQLPPTKGGRWLELRIASRAAIWIAPSLVASAA